MQPLFLLTQNHKHWPSRAKGYRYLPFGRGGIGLTLDSRLFEASNPAAAGAAIMQWVQRLATAAERPGGGGPNLVAALLRSRGVQAVNMMHVVVNRTVVMRVRHLARLVCAGLDLGPRRTLCMHVVLDRLGDQMSRYEGFRLLGGKGLTALGVHHPAGMRVEAVPCERGMPRRGMLLRLLPDASAQSTWTALAPLAAVHGPGYPLLKASARRVTPSHGIAFHHTGGVCRLTNEVPDAAARLERSRRIFRFPCRLIGDGKAVAGPVELGDAFAMREVAVELPPHTELGDKLILEVNDQPCRGIDGLARAARLAFATDTKLCVCYRIKHARGR